MVLNLFYVKEIFKLKDDMVTLNHPEVNEHLPDGRKVNSLEAPEKNLKVFESCNESTPRSWY